MLRVAIQTAFVMSASILCAKKRLKEATTVSQTNMEHSYVLTAGLSAKTLE